MRDDGNGWTQSETGAKSVEKKLAGRVLGALSETSSSRLNSGRAIGCHDYRSFRVAAERPAEKIREAPVHGVRNGSVVPVVAVLPRVHSMEMKRYTSAERIFGTLETRPETPRSPFHFSFPRARFARLGRGTLQSITEGLTPAGSISM